ncbi:MAG: hypothetical protein VKI63_06855 [Cyanobium sp.]|nr:hypothetical protein [Cyanobium sp.]
MPWESVSLQALASLPARLQHLTFWNTSMDSSLPNDEFSSRSAAQATASNKKPPP